MTIRRGYSDGPHGQIHWRAMDPEGEASASYLWCLHPAPFSGLAFTTIMPHLARGCRVFALDYPGHGGSDPLEGAPTMEADAEAMAAVIDGHSDGEPVDFFGFHTGRLVAMQLANVFPRKGAPTRPD